MAIKSFRRIEKKFVINQYQRDELLKTVNQHMDLDPYCLNEATYKIQNIYLDTDNYELIFIQNCKVKNIIDVLLVWLVLLDLLGLFSSASLQRTSRFL